MLEQMTLNSWRIVSLRPRIPTFFYCPIQLGLRIQLMKLEHYKHKRGHQRVWHSPTPNHALQNSAPHRLNSTPDVAYSGTAAPWMHKFVYFKSFCHSLLLQRPRRRLKVSNLSAARVRGFSLLHPYGFMTAHFVTACTHTPVSTTY